MNPEFVDTIRGKVAYTKSGNSKNGLIYLHGWSGSSYAPSQLETRHPHRTVVRIHLPNNGQSYYHPEDENLESMVAALRQTIDAFAFESFVILGYSVGATLALKLAVQGINHLEKAILYSTYSNPWRKSLARKMLDYAKDLFINSQNKKDSKYGTYFDDNLAARLSLQKISPEFWAAGSRLIAPKADSLCCDVLMIHGRQDHVVTPKELESSVATHQRLKIKYITGGHQWHHQIPGMFYGILSRELRDPPYRSNRKL